MNFLSSFCAIINCFLANLLIIFSIIIIISSTMSVNMFFIFIVNQLVFDLLCYLVFH